MRTQSNTVHELRIAWGRFGGLIAGILSWVLVGVLANLFGWWIVPMLMALMTYLFWDECQALNRQAY